jgi:hypothetical protein
MPRLPASKFAEPAGRIPSVETTPNGAVATPDEEYLSALGHGLLGLLGGLLALWDLVPDRVRHTTLYECSAKVAEVAVTQTLLLVGNHGDLHGHLSFRRSRRRGQNLLTGETS